MVPPDPITIPDAWPDQFYTFAESEGLKLTWKDGLTRMLNRSPHWLLDSWVARRLHERERIYTLDQLWAAHPGLLPIVERLQRVFGDVLWGFPPLIAPEDHYALLSQVFSGNFREVETVITIEQEFEANLPDALFPMRLTLLELAQELQGQLQKRRRAT